MAGLMGAVDVFVIQDTWMDEAQMRHHYGGSGYHVFASDRGPRRGGGAAILVRQLNSLQVGTIDANHVGLIHGVDHVSVRISDSREPPEAGLTVTSVLFHSREQITLTTLTGLASIGGRGRWVLGGVFGGHAEAWDANTRADTQGRALQTWASQQGLSIANCPAMATREARGLCSSPDLTLSRGATVHQWRVLKNDPLASDHNPIVFRVPSGKQGRKLSHHAALRRLEGRLGANAARGALETRKQARDTE
jgi:hypothetical protein